MNSFLTTLQITYNEGTINKIFISLRKGRKKSYAIMSKAKPSKKTWIKLWNRLVRSIKPFKKKWVHAYERYVVEHNREINHF